MSALERLTAFLCARPGTEDMDEWHADWAARLLSQHAHELAEQIRDERPQWGGAPGGAWFEWGAAADLIDPEVE